MTDERKYEITAGLLKNIRKWVVSAGVAEKQVYLEPNQLNYTGYVAISRVVELRAWEDVSFMQDLVQDMLALPDLTKKLIFRAQCEKNKTWWVELFYYLPNTGRNFTQVRRHIYSTYDLNLAYAIWILMASYYELLSIEETEAADIHRAESEMFIGDLQVTKLADEMKAKQSEKTKEENKKADSPDPSKLFNQILTEMYNIRRELEKCARHLETLSAA